MLWVTQQPQNSEEKKRNETNEKLYTYFTVVNECKGIKGKLRACSITGMSCYDT